MLIIRTPHTDQDKKFRTESSGQEVQDRKFRTESSGQKECIKFCFNGTKYREVTADKQKTHSDFSQEIPDHVESRYPSGGSVVLDSSEGSSRSARF